MDASEINTEMKEKELKDRVDALEKTNTFLECRLDTVVGILARLQVRVEATITQGTV